MSRDVVIQNPPADRREARHADARNSQKEKETFVDTIVEEDVGSMPDSGWLLIMVSTAGEAIGWVERFCRAAEMVVHRRIVVLHHGAYGHFESFGGPIEVCVHRAS
ncbi:hypothetical protein GOP47_0025295 [Adiantum capillus-veneris]|uniref:Uncharacterized protein n=1 Tax=Adiantum capillus-veneris TaxID=13818 RepID=A0A9D4Z3Z3_ADICA|nr:hypothetical protein GOP47_0025295 [Adiantum capillus-veneris]